MIYDKTENKYYEEESKITLIYWRSQKYKKSYYFPIIENNEVDIFFEDKN